MKLILFILVLITWGHVYIFNYFSPNFIVVGRDEMFHVPQTQKYCQGYWEEWDPKITSLPGSYLLFVGVIRSLSALPFGPSIELLCTTEVLRFVNSSFLVMCVIPATSIVKRVKMLQNHPNDKLNSFEFALAPIIALFSLLFPPLVFSSGLVYTDTSGVFTTLIALDFGLKKQRFVSALVSFFAVVCRQTNIVWPLLIVLMSEASVYNEGKWTHRSDNILARIRKVFLHLFFDLPYLVVRWWAMAFLAFAFIVFLRVNGGIVVGDKGAHVAGFHFSQPVYLLVVLFPFLFLPSTYSSWPTPKQLPAMPMDNSLDSQKKTDKKKRRLTKARTMRTHLSAFPHSRDLSAESRHLAVRGSFSSVFLAPVEFVRDFTRAVWYGVVSGRPMLSAVQLTCVALLLGVFAAFGSVAHPYLVSDNRHIVFYFWKDLASKWVLRSLFAVPSSVFLVLLSKSLVRQIGIMASVGFALCVFAVTVPSPLIEFRYYIIPAVLLRLVLPPPPTRVVLVMEVLPTLSVLCLMLLVHSLKTVEWEDGNVYRIIW